MSHDYYAPYPLPTLPVCALWPEVTERWGEVSADQADGFAPVADTALPDPDLNDDRGYGFGV